MNVESQVCSLELARRLKELDVKQDSLFYYLNIDGKGKYFIYFDEYLPEEYEYEGEPISAFTVAELGNFLNWEALYIFGMPKDLSKFINGKDTEADFRAKIIIYFLEQD